MSETLGPINLLSYGAGRQTAGMLALIKLGRLLPPDMVVFADTGGEKPATYQHIKEWAKPLCAGLGIPFHEVKYTIRGEPWTLYDYAWKYQWLPQPWQRMCSTKFKMTAIERFLRPHKPVRVWLGISLDEAHRQRVSPTSWVEHVYPLVDARLTLRDCITALRVAAIPVPPKSSCFFCPFQRFGQWMDMKRGSPDLYQKAIELEEHAREKNPSVTLNGKAPLRSYLKGNQLAWEELLDAEAGCHTGLCFV